MYYVAKIIFFIIFGTDRKQCGYLYVTMSFGRDFQTLGYIISGREDEKGLWNS